MNILQLAAVVILNEERLEPSFEVDVQDFSVYVRILLEISVRQRMARVLFFFIHGTLAIEHHASIPEMSQQDL